MTDVRIPALVTGRPDLRCPLTWLRVQNLLRTARFRPWIVGVSPTLDRDHTADTSAILERGRPTRIALTYDLPDRALHLSVSHPRLGTPPPYQADLPSAAELDAWSRVFFGDRHHLAQVELGRVAHLRLFFDATGNAYIPGEGPQR